MLTEKNQGEHKTYTLIRATTKVRRLLLAVTTSSSLQQGWEKFWREGFQVSSLKCVLKFGSYFLILHIELGYMGISYGDKFYK
jgi:hypothetical protein